jgi:hypothetical protein
LAATAADVRGHVVRRGELDDRGPSVEQWNVAGAGEEGAARCVAGLVGLGRIGVADRQSPGANDAEVPALAAVVGQTAEEGRRVAVLSVVQERDRPLVEVGLADLDLRLVDDDGRLALVCPGHLLLLPGVEVGHREGVTVCSTM